MNTNMNMDRVKANAIASEYTPRETSKLVALKKLDRRAKTPAHVFAYVFGVIMTLTFGVGMCLTMGVIGGGTAVMMGIGVGVGVLGILGMSVNYPIYARILAAGKKKYAYEIMELAKEINQEDEA